jgi:hypothetical protein
MRNVGDGSGLKVEDTVENSIISDLGGTEDSGKSSGIAVNSDIKGGMGNTVRRNISGLTVNSSSNFFSYRRGTKRQGRKSRSRGRGDLAGGAAVCKRSSGKKDTGRTARKASKLTTR